MQYADFASWQRGWLQGDVLAKQVAWWKDQLAGAPHVLDLPTDKPRPTQRSPRGALLPLHLPRVLSERLGALARQEGATSFMALLSVWQLLLSRYSRQQDLLVGSPIAGRNQGELEGLVGFFINTLVLRARIHPDASFRSLLTQVRDTTFAAYEHQDLPFEKLVEELQVQRDLGRTPLVQVIFALQNAPAGTLQAPGLTLRMLDVDSATARFDLGLLLTETPDGLHGAIEYSTDLFEHDTVARMAGHLRTLMEAAVSGPDLPLASLPWLTPAERQQVLVDFNDSVRPYASDISVAAQFALQVARHPDAVALESEDERLTYAQLDARANQLAHELRAQGVGPEKLVAVCLERSVSFVVCALATLKAGGAYLPMDASYPAQRLAFMLEDARPHLLITRRDLHGRLPPVEGDAPILFVEELSLTSHPATAPVVDVGPHNLAYVIFTSGSTGRPKGIGIEQRSVLRLVQSDSFGNYGVGETMMLLAPVSFDGSVLELWLPLLSGCRLVIFSGQYAASDLEKVARVVKHHGVTLAHVPTGLFSQIVEYQSDILGPLREVFVGGDIISAPHVRKAVASGTTSVTNIYGPSECTVASNTFKVSHPDQVDGSVPIGPMLSNTTGYVLDASMHPVPVGVPGELYLGGAGLSRGYVSRPELTAERFVPDAQGTTPGARLYRTGDLVRWGADGVLEFLGRIDHQVKVRGFRIELAEVEAALRDLPSVLEVAVVVREDVPGDKRLVAYAMPREGHVLDVTALRAGMRQRLPEYMVPSTFVTLATLPLSPSNKVDRKALPAPDAVSTGRQGRFVEPTDPTEQRMAAVFARELGAERVGVHDHLFEDLGGTSLSVVRIAARLREELQRDVPVVWLFEHSTVNELARRMERESGGPAASAAPVA
ncbi:non-ribosomal peptide synthetase, partial [Corallococcus terminator]|uniref:non-ribosomal peptide synthetase n=1 Tax=Corallococcus terminator TaxID=2316733 RepID=UPI001FC9F266